MGKIKQTTRNLGMQVAPSIIQLANLSTDKRFKELIESIVVDELIV